MSDPARVGIVRPSLLTWIAIVATRVDDCVQRGVPVFRYPSLPWLLPVSFKANGFPNGWQFKTYPRVFVPVFIQIALVVTLGAVAALLLSRPHGAHDEEAPDVQGGVGRGRRCRADRLHLGACFRATRRMPSRACGSASALALAPGTSFLEIVGIPADDWRRRAHPPPPRSSPAAALRRRALAPGTALQQRRRSGALRADAQRLALDPQLRPAGRGGAHGRGPGDWHHRPDRHPRPASPISQLDRAISKIFSGGGIFPADGGSI